MQVLENLQPKKRFWRPILFKVTCAIGNMWSLTENEDVFRKRKKLWLTVMWHERNCSYYQNYKKEEMIVKFWTFECKWRRAQMLVVSVVQFSLHYFPPKGNLFFDTYCLWHICSWPLTMASALLKTVIMIVELQHQLAAVLNRGLAKLLFMFYCDMARF